MWGLGTVLGGRYTLAERLGGGAMGEVWRADDGVLERQVAVKILLPALLADVKFAERFRREAKVLAALDHPGIVDVHDYGESGSEPRVAYIVMELVVGRPMDAVMADGRGDGDGAVMPAERALGIVAQALDALHAAHLRGIVHRDVKPSNLMIGADDRVTVTDFGIAHSTAETKLTASHAVLGTVRYIAPEQARGSGAVPASDQYAIGVLCYELLTGQPLFTGDAVYEVLLKHIREPAPELPADFPEAVRAFVAKALAKEPEDRYADAAEMAAVARAAARGVAAGGSEAAVTAVTAVAVGGAVGVGVGEAGSGTAGAADEGSGAESGVGSGPATLGEVAADGVGVGEADADSDDAVASNAAPAASDGVAAGAAGGVEPASGEADLDKAAASSGSVSESAADDAPIVPEASAPAAADVATDVPPPAVIPASDPTPAAAPASDSGASAATPASAPASVPASSATPPEPVPVPPDATPTRASPLAWKRHGTAAVLLVLGVIAGVVATVLFVKPFSGRSDADRNVPNAQPAATESRTSPGASADPGPGSASPPTAVTGSPDTTAGASQPPGAAQGSGSAGGPVPPPAGTNAGGANGSASAGAGGSPGGGGTGSGGGTQPKPPTSTPPPAQSTPQGCGGDRWGAITSVADGRRIGLAADSPTQGKELIMGGNSQYGWVHSVSTWDTFNTCSLSGPAMGQPYGNSTRPELAVGFGYSFNWRLTEAPTSGAVYIKDYAGQNCLTNNGPGKPLSVVDCTPGNKYQQWRIP
ncbi:serine/threonine-protein kinase [Embleya scabrispora]|uniref:serine/threonine-protein kinase n=1 Tax=Embleya scabrispora TaxID=159449 RepID=UPI00035CBE0A|nr:serine/threonine-protein kinase [Embleya scabrispora]MYS85211.1 protein kinase [Streptomyces sp. SID5474]